MQKLILDPSMRSQLSNVKDPVELCDESGHILGFFLSPEEYQRLKEDRQLLYDWAKSQVTDEEIERARQEPGGMTTAEAIAYLEGLAGSGGQRS